MDANDWMKFVHKTMLFEVKTTIECGSYCNQHDTACDMFILRNNKKCHMGTFENGQTNFLNQLSGEFPVHLSLGKKNNHIIMVL